MADSASVAASFSSCDDMSLRSILGDVGLDEEWLQELVDKETVAADSVEILNDPSGLLCNRCNLSQSEGPAESLVYVKNI